MHQSVLLQEVIDLLDIKDSDVFFDATFGGGGHSREICSIIGSDGILIGIDTDSSAIDKGKSILKDCVSDVYLRVSNFRNISQVFSEIGIEMADKYLFDLGWSSIQLEESGRGLSFQKDEPLLMTLSDKVTKNTLTAERIVNEWSVDQIEIIIRGYGEEHFSKRIAHAIVDSREENRITIATQLADIISKATPVWYRRGRIHPATKTFQALRIAVNDEIESLTIGLESAYTHLNDNGRIAVITFHSIEDRTVKQLFRKWQKDEKGVMENKKPIRPSHEEVKRNPRSRSAKLRVFIKSV